MITRLTIVGIMVRDQEELLARGVKFSSPPTEHFYGLEAVFEDLYGNPISMVELSSELREQMENR